MKILDIKPLGQRDDRWKNQRLGMVNGVTIGSDGCVITSHSMLLTFHGKPFLPNELDDFLTDNGLYYDEAGDGPNGDDLWIPSNINKIYAPMKYVTTTYCANTYAPIDKIKAAIDANQPPTLWVINNGVSHNVLAVGYDGNEIIVNDPWMGDQVRCNQRWGDTSAKAIMAVDYYEGPVPGVTVAVPQADFEGMVFKSTQHDKTCKTWEFTNPRNTTAEQIDDKIQKSINAYKGQATTAMEAKGQSDTKLAAALQEVENRKEQVSRLEKQLTDDAKVYQAEIDALKKIPQINPELVSTLKASVTQYKGKYDTEAKAKGKALNDLATTKKQLETCQAGGTVATKSLWTAIMDFLKGTKVVK